MIDNDLPELGPDIRELLEAERRAPGAPTASKARVLEGLQRAIEQGPGGGHSGPASDGGPSGGPAPTLPAAGASAGVLAKLGVPGAIGLFVAGAIVGGLTWDVMRPPRVEKVIVEVPVEVPVQVPVEVPVQVPVEVPVQVPIEAPTEAKATAPAPRKPSHARPTPTPLEAPRPELSPDKALEAERLLVTQARSALSRGRAADALEALAMHARRFPMGQLAEDRAALEVQALVSAGRKAEAKDKAEAFHRDFPKSLLRPVIEAAIRD